MEKVFSILQFLNEQLKSIQVEHFTYYINILTDLVKQSAIMISLIEVRCWKASSVRYWRAWQTIAISKVKRVELCGKAVGNTTTAISL